MGNIRKIFEGSASIISDYSSVTNMRNLIYKKKLEIIKTPMVQEIITTTFQMGLPAQIFANREGVFARIYDPQSNTYHPNGVKVYEPDVSFDYAVAMALLLIMQDIYPNVYEVNKVTNDQLQEQLNHGSWQGVLTMNDEYMYKSIAPAFDISNIAVVPIEALPLTLDDKYTQAPTSKISLTLGIISLVLHLIGGLLSILAGLCALGGIIIGLCAIFATPKGKKKPRGAIWGIILSILSWILPTLIALLALSSAF